MEVHILKGTVSTEFRQNSNLFGHLCEVIKVVCLLKSRYISCCKVNIFVKFCLISFSKLYYIQVYRTIEDNDFVVPDCSPFTGPGKFVRNIIKNNYMYAKSIFYTYCTIYLSKSFSNSVFTIYYKN